MTKKSDLMLVSVMRRSIRGVRYCVDNILEMAFWQRKFHLVIMSRVHSA